MFYRNRIISHLFGDLCWIMISVISSLLFAVERASALDNEESVKEFNHCIDQLLGAKKEDSSEIEIARIAHDIQNNMSLEIWRSAAVNSFQQHVPNEHAMPTDYRCKTLNAVLRRRFKTSPQDFAIVWQDLSSLEVPIAWKMFIIQSAPHVAGRNIKKQDGEILDKINPESLLEDLVSLLKKQQSVGINLESLKAIESLLLDFKEKIQKSRRESAISAIVALLEESMDNGEQGYNHKYNVTESALTVLYRCIRRNVVPKSGIESQILLLEESLENVDAETCFSYIRLLKHGLGIDPGENVFKIAEAKAKTPREKKTLKIYKRPR